MRAICSGLRSAVRLICAFQARSSRTWVSMAVNAAGSIERQLQLSPDRRRASPRTHRGVPAGRPRTRAGGREYAAGEGTDQGFVHARTTLSRCAVPAPRGETFLAPPAFQFSPAVRYSDRISPIAEAGEVTVLGLGRRPRLARQWCKAGSVAIHSQTGQPAFPRLLWTSLGLWRNVPTNCRACGWLGLTHACRGNPPPGLSRRWCGADRPAHAPSDDLHHLFCIGLRLAGLDGRRETARDVVLHQQQRHSIHRRAQARRSAAGCRCSTRRARSSARHRAPGPPCATVAATAARDPSV